MKPASLLLVATALLLAFTTPASATCNPPSQPGAIICYPTPNSTVTFPETIEAAATGDSPITAMVLYADGQNVAEVSNQNVMTANVNVFYSGWHHLVLNAWDSGGRLFQYSEYIYVVDYLNFRWCAAPSQGIAICTPAPNSWQENQFPILVNGSSGIKAYNVYLNGKLILQTTGRIVDTIDSLTPTAAADNLVVKGYDAQGNVYQASSSFHVFYSYNCGPDGCSPGIVINSPANYADVSSPFVLNADTYQPPHPITAMRAYIDNTLVTSSTGPTLYGTVTASKGTHLLTVQSWDTTGALYRTQQTVNVQ